MYWGAIEMPKASEVFLLTIPILEINHFTGLGRNFFDSGAKVIVIEQLWFKKFTFANTNLDNEQCYL